MSSDRPTVAEPKPLVSNRTYDVLSYIALIFLPAFGALYFGLSQIWGLPNGTEVVGTVTLVDTFLGALLKLSKNQYDKSDAKYDGALVINDTDPEKDVYSFELKDHPDTLAGKKELTFKVEPTA